MRITDGPALWKAIQKNGLDQKRLGELSMTEIELLSDLLAAHCNSGIVPYFKDGALVIPFGAPSECCFWKHNYSDREKYHLLLRLGVPEDAMTKYMSPRAIGIARGECDAMGRPVARSDKHDR